MPLNTWIRVFLEKLVVTCLLKKSVVLYLRLPYCAHKRLTVNMMYAVDNIERYVCNVYPSAPRYSQDVFSIRYYD
jgi:hypothetical protein